MVHKQGALIEPRGIETLQCAYPSFYAQRFNWTERNWNNHEVAAMTSAAIALIEPRGIETETSVSGARSQNKL